MHPQLHMQKSIKCIMEGGLEEHKCLQNEEILLAQGIYTGFRVSRYEKIKWNECKITVVAKSHRSPLKKHTPILTNQISRLTPTLSTEVRSI